MIDTLAPVTAHPVRSARIALGAACAVIALFTVGGIWLRPDTAGESVNFADQVGIIGAGVLIAVPILSLLRPRLRVDASGIETRGFFGGYRHVDWDLVRRIEFPPKARFARVVLPGDELVVLYAVQRGDRERSVEVMDALRAWQKHIEEKQIGTT